MISLEQTNQLAIRAAEGDTDAFGQLYSTIWRDLYRFALYFLHSHEDAEDAVQEAAIAAYRHIGKMRNSAAFKAYIFKILVNCCKKLSKRKNVDKRVLSLDELNTDICDSEGSNIQKALELYDLLDRLNENERLIITLSITAGYKSDEIAKILSRPSGTVRSTLSRALTKLRYEQTQ